MCPRRGVAFWRSFVPEDGRVRVPLSALRRPPQVRIEVVYSSVTRIANGVPIVDISVSYGVSAKDLDLSTNSGAKELEQRVRNAAAAACQEIGRQHPGATPSERECTANAAGKAMSQVRQLVAAAEKNRGNR